MQNKAKQSYGTHLHMINWSGYLCSLDSVYHFLGEFFWISAVLILLFYIVLPKTLSKGKYSQVVDVQKLAITSTVLTLILFLNGFRVIGDTSANLTSALFKTDTLVMGVKSITLLALVLVLILWKDYKMNEKVKTNNLGEILIILLGSIGVIFLAAGNDLLGIYLAMELQALSFYSLAAMNREEEASTEAGLKYFVLGALASGIYLFGASLIYGNTGLTNIDSLREIAVFNGDNTAFWMGTLFILIALVFKVGGAPFHMWLPDVYQGSPTIITAFFAIVPKLSILALIFNMLGLDPHNLFLGNFFTVCALLSMIVGAFGALNQSLIKRLFAYSAISHIGYVLICFVAGVQTQASAALILYMIVYMTTSLNLFTIILSLRKQLNFKPLTYIIELFALSRAQPILTITLAFLLFSLAGVPPLAGFFAKWYVFSAAVQNELYLLAIVGILTSVIASVYYLKVISQMYMDSNSTQLLLEILSPVQKVAFSKSILLGATLYFILFALVIPTPLLLIAQDITTSLF